jgi:hypothetical protein
VATLQNNTSNSQTKLQNNKTYYFIRPKPIKKRYGLFVFLTQQKRVAICFFGQNRGGEASKWTSRPFVAASRRLNSKITIIVTPKRSQTTLQNSDLANCPRTTKITKIAFWRQI